ncbi:hypothetical protein FRB94_004688 [Tulasnella sp. JGI-2019a]|nr:hypothetical protein FRB94_004688 [Tulasnella sp. JGI-2019a]KAG9006334.1 hypothetical protein FRB93_008823 [Tulasnella sp. JGI-2019a]KAG9038003.1 hypothetical protein FRB95_003396 [Tulasnella sp. JGI-2019a]
MPSWKKIVSAKQAERAARIRAMLATPAVGEKSDLGGKVLPPAHELLQANATQIVQHIKNGDPGWTAERVLLAFARQAVRAHEATNCLTEVMFADALQEARALDQDFARTKTLKGPLHGVPISFKDLYRVKGYDYSVGFTRYCGKPSDVDGELVSQVRAAGGIPFVKTNVPQTMLTFECANPVFGRTTNPWSSAHSSGGSSGGEAALLACDGSALGFGSDIGGSLRIPTSYCGLYSMKPGHSRASVRGSRELASGFEGIRLCMGPMGRSVDDIELACRLIFGQSTKLDIWLPPLPYREVMIPNKLKFGYYKSDALVRASPAVQRAVQETVDVLRKQGHECVEFVVPDMIEGFGIMMGLVSADKFKMMFSHMDKDPRDPSLLMASVGPRLPSFLRHILVWSLRTLGKDPVLSRLVKNFHGRSAGDFVSLAAARDEYCQRFVTEVWDAHGFDGIICPVQAMPAVPHGAATDAGVLPGTTSLYNVVDHPVGIVPVTRVDKTKDQLDKAWEASGDKGSPLVYSKLYEGKKPFYDAVAMHGLPVGVQIIGRHWEDEKVIKMMRVVDDALGQRSFGPGTYSSAMATKREDQ